MTNLERLLKAKILYYWLKAKETSGKLEEEEKEKLEKLKTMPLDSAVLMEEEKLNQSLGIDEVREILSRNKRLLKEICYVQEKYPRLRAVLSSGELIEGSDFSEEERLWMKRLGIIPSDEERIVVDNTILWVPKEEISSLKKVLEDLKKMSFKLQIVPKDSKEYEEIQRRYLDLIKKKKEFIEKYKVEFNH